LALTTTTTTTTEFENVRVQQFVRVKDFALASAGQSLLDRSRAATGKACFDFDLGKIVPSRVVINHQNNKNKSCESSLSKS
jgi:hypothetical protein